MTKEYPEGQRVAEMALVKMLRDRRSWDDYTEIVQALLNLRFQAKSMQKEQSLITAETGGAIGTAIHKPRDKPEG